MEKNKNKTRNGGNTSRTPEFIPSTFNWLTPDMQSKKAEELDKATKK